MATTCSPDAVGLGAQGSCVVQESEGFRALGSSALDKGLLLGPLGDPSQIGSTSFPPCPAYHHRPSSTAEGGLGFFGVVEPGCGWRVAAGWT